MNRFFGSLTLAIGVFACGSGFAGTFSNISVTGSLAAGASWITTPTDIDFTLPSASVGDLGPSTSGSITIQYDFSDANAVDLNTLFVLGALDGNGTISISETIVDLNTNATIGSFNGIINNSSQLPFSTPVALLPPSNNIRVTKVFNLNAPNGNNFDYAAVSLIEQRLRVVPEPATLTALGIGLVAALRKRTKA